MTMVVRRGSPKSSLFSLYSPYRVGSPKKETGDRRQEIGDRGKRVEDRGQKQEARGKKTETGAWGQETTMGLGPEGAR